ncbi:hypothetical protein CHU92_09680 [Flavobacterium cyanobacteriorum]|uniref:DUF3822 domain-containing protein n=1 Tax=Flavobacterium cyanobacteriorum TaxID=2022802 RepID=A0A255Z532_9FLAO|nr:DUF3822 family protein [Flavobacterium cyanobacteriorum]OYQ36598.1 hypothetical protein CHU92_09680 [Flavobacterium cyanobacteriorum]
MNDTITDKNYRKLCLQVSLSGASFCVFDTLNWDLLRTHTQQFIINKDIEDQLWKLFVNYPELEERYDEVLVLHDNNFNTFVPHALFDDSFLGSYLQYNTKVFETDFFAYDSIGSYEIHNVYVPQANINNFLLDRFGSFEYKNTNSILVNKLLDASKNIDTRQVYVHVQESHFEIVAARNQKLLLFNSFEYGTPEDFLYYLLFTLEQLQLNPENVRVWLLGKIGEDDVLFNIAYKYIRHVALFDTTSLQHRYNIGQQAASQHFILYSA